MPSSSGCHVMVASFVCENVLLCYYGSGYILITQVILMLCCLICLKMYLSLDPCFMRFGYLDF